MNFSLCWGITEACPFIVQNHCNSVVQNDFAWVSAGVSSFLPNFLFVPERNVLFSHGLLKANSDSVERVLTTGNL